MQATNLGEVAAHDDAEFRGQVLNQDRDEVRPVHYPEQQVAEVRTALEVRNEVLWTDI
jgi:hypothetical protein